MMMHFCRKMYRLKDPKQCCVKRNRLYVPMSGSPYGHSHSVCGTGRSKLCWVRFSELRLGCVCAVQQIHNTPV
jgi:hypothetical protein